MHLLLLFIIIQQNKLVHKCVYCAFIDNHKAFDSINRPLLWYKLLSPDINGKLLMLLEKVKSCIQKDNILFEYCIYTEGLTHGNTLSPLLFSLFLNDISQSISRSYTRLNISDTRYPSFTDEHIELLKVFAPLYADDTFLLSENERKLQVAPYFVH